MGVLYSTFQDINLIIFHVSVNYVIGGRADQTGQKSPNGNSKIVIGGCNHCSIFYWNILTSVSIALSFNLWRINENMNENVNVAKLKVCINAWPRRVVTDNLTFLALASSDGWLGVDSVAEKLRGACAILPYTSPSCSPPRSRQLSLEYYNMIL